MALLFSHTSGPLMGAVPSTLTIELADRPDLVALAQHHDHFIVLGAVPQSLHTGTSGIHTSP